MTASTGTIRGGLGNRQLGLALAGVALAAAVVGGGLAVGQLTKAQLAPIAPAPAQAFDHGSATWDTEATPLVRHGTADHGAGWDPALDLGTTFLPLRPGHARSYDASPNRFEDHTHPNFSSDSSLYHPRD